MEAPADDDRVRPASNFARQNYIEYDFSVMSDTKGGFLSQNDDLSPATAKDRVQDPAAARPAGMTLDEWERLQLLKKLRDSKAGPYEPGMSRLTEKKDRTVCVECKSWDVDWRWVDAFRIGVCGACKDNFPEKYSLLTKTEAREDYLLTNPELQDEDILPHLKRPNPHKSSWNDMQLYLRTQVEAYAFSAQKWGSADALDAEFERRQVERRERKDRKFRTKLEDLKKRTRTEAYRRNHALVEKGRRSVYDGPPPPDEARFGVRITRGQHHVHDWGRPLKDAETGIEVRTCVDCGLQSEQLEL